MSRKTIIMIGMFIGSYTGGYLSTLLGAEVISMASVLGSGAGGLAGIWLGYMITR